MSEQSQSPELERYLTVFEGSSPEDVSHARRLWSSLSLLPPQESRLVSADVRQRLPVSRPQRSTATAATAAPEPPGEASAREKERREERRRYEAMAENRREVLGLLQRQREQRIQRELLSKAFKPKTKQDTEKTPQTQDRAECESDRHLVLQLQ